MPNLTSVGITNGVPNSGTGTVSTIDALMAQINSNGQKTSANSAPVVLASDQPAIPTTTSVTASSNNLTNTRIVSAATTNATNLKASAGQIYTIDLFNSAAYTVFLKLYNKASAPTVGTDTPAWTIPIPAGSGYSKTFYFGLTQGTGISYAITKNIGDSDTTAVAASDLTGLISWI